MGTAPSARLVDCIIISNPSNPLPKTFRTIDTAEHPTRSADRDCSPIHLPQSQPPAIATEPTIANMDAASQAISYGLPPSFGRHVHSPRLKAERERNAARPPAYPPAIHQHARPYNGQYQQPQPYHQQPGGYAPQGHPQQGFPPQQGMYYQQQPNGPPQGYYANNGGRSGAEGGLCAALAASLACCCCLDVCIF